MRVPGQASGPPDRLVPPGDGLPSPHSDGPEACAAWYTTSVLYGHAPTCPVPGAGYDPPPSVPHARRGQAWPNQLQYPSGDLRDGVHAALASAVHRAAARRPLAQTAWQSWCDACDGDDRLGPSTISAAQHLRGTRVRGDSTPRRQYGARLPVTAHAALAQRWPSSGGWVLGLKTAQRAGHHAPAPLTT